MYNIFKWMCVCMCVCVCVFEYMYAGMNVHTLKFLIIIQIITCQDNDPLNLFPSSRHQPYMVSSFN